MATLSMSSLRICSVTVPHLLRRVNPFSVCTVLTGGQKWRISNGMANDGLAYGPLTDDPDWSYADGKPAPETKRRKERKNRRLRESERIMQYFQEVDDGIKEENPYKGIAKR